MDPNEEIRNKSFLVFLKNEFLERYIVVSGKEILRLLNNNLEEAQCNFEGFGYVEGFTYTDIDNFKEIASEEIETLEKFNIVYKKKERRNRFSLK